MKYCVAVKEVWSQLVSVEAKNQEEAIKKVKGGEGLYLEGMDENFQYSHTLDSDEWSVAEEI